MEPIVTIATYVAMIFVPCILTVLVVPSNR
jgi:hypothetical protein